jgi:glycosyltransferase involved in cell wall biosynthesis
MATPPTSVAVVIPTRNRREMVARAVVSVLAQDPPAAEVIVVDDASTYGTVEALLERFGDRIGVIRTEANIERGAARNLGAGRSCC